ncbi:MAG: type II toxin-antitoxin system RelE/ParE family toxin [Chthoniobacterales bacterium]|nr:type II toxin-antitoxin system RelE/ParE family toxin [Chthoniobacterales bacterium]
MGYSLGFAPQAIQDLDQIVTYISYSNPPAAIRLKKALLSKIELFKVAPEMGVAVRRRQDIRYLVHPSYLIFYYVDYGLKRAEVLRFLHGARNIEKIAF